MRSTSFQTGKTRICEDSAMSWLARRGKTWEETGRSILPSSRGVFWGSTEQSTTRQTRFSGNAGHS